MSSLQRIIGRQPTELGTAFRTDDFSISRGSVTDGSRFRQLKSLNAPSVSDFMKTFKGWDGEKLVNSYLDMGIDDMKYAWGADINMNDFLRTEAYCIGLGRLMVGGSLTDLQTKNYGGLSLMSKMLLPDGIPEENVTFSLDIVYDQMTMALPGAIRSLSADVNAWKTTLKFGLTQYTTSIQFLTQELTYLVKGEPVSVLAKRKFGQMMSRFRLSIIHSHAQAACRQPSFIETVIGRQMGKALQNLGGVVYNMAKCEALLLGICTRNPATLAVLIEMALMALTGFGDLDNSNAHFFAAMNSQFFTPKLVTHTAVVSTAMPAYTYNTSRDRIQAAARSEILSVDWEDAVIAPAGNGPLSSVSEGYTPTLATPAASLAEGSISLPAVMAGGSVVPIILFDGMPICRDGPSMGRPFVTSGLQYRWFAVGCPPPVLGGLSPSTLYDETEAKPVSPATINMYSPRKTCVFDENGDTTFVELHHLHLQSEVDELWDLNRARTRFNSMPPEVREVRRVEAYQRAVETLWHADAQQKLSHAGSPYEFSPRFMVSLQRSAVGGENFTPVVKRRAVMWNQTAMSSPQVEHISVGAELYNTLGLNNPQLKQAISFIQTCGTGADDRMLRDVLAFKMLMGVCDLDTIYQNRAANGHLTPILHMHEHRPQPHTHNIPQNVTTTLAYEAMSTTVPRLFNRLLGGNGHLLLTDPFGWHAFNTLLAYFEEHLDEQANGQPVRRFGFHMTLDQFSALVKIKDMLSMVESTVGKWLSPLQMPVEPYLFLGEDSTIAVRWSWIAAAIFNTAATFGTDLAYAVPAVGTAANSLPHATCSGSLSVIGNDLPLRFSNMIQTAADEPFHGGIMGVEVYQHKPCAILYHTQYTPKSEASHDHVVGPMGRARAVALRRQFTNCPQVALALGAHYSLVLTAKNVVNFDKSYFSGWSKLVVRRMEFDASGISVMPIQGHLMIVGNSKFDLEQQLGLDRQFALRSMMRYGVVPMGIFGQGVHYANVFIKGVRGLGLDYVNGLQARQRYAGLGGMEPKSACMQAMILDWGSALTPPIQGAATGVGPILPANGRFAPQMGEVTALDYFRPDNFNQHHYFSTCPMHNNYLNENQVLLHRVLGQMADFNADMFGTGRRNAVLSNTLKQYYQFLRDTDTSRMGHMERELQTRLQSMTGEEYNVVHGFNNRCSMFYVENSVMGDNSEHILKSPVNMDNRGTLNLMCRTDNFTFDPNNTEVPMDQLQLDLQGLNPFRLLEVNPTTRVNLTQQMLNNAYDNAV